MPQFTSPRFERIIIQPQTAFNAVPNSTGTWTQTGAKLLRMPSGTKITAPPPLIPVPWKTGTRSTQPGIVGRKSTASWSLPNIPVIPSGSAGTVPDADALLQGIFGLAGTISAGVSVTYSFSDSAFLPFVLARFQHGQSALTQQFGIGALVSDFNFSINGDVFTMGASGPLYWALDSENFSNEDTAGKCGLTVYPTEPSSPTVVGTIQQGFVGTATFDGTGLDTTNCPLISCSVRGRTGTTYVADAFGVSYPALPVGGERMISISFGLVDTDASILNTLKTKAKAKTPINISIQVGNVAGSIVTLALKSVQLAVPDYGDDNARVVASFGDSAAHATAVANIDDFSITFS